MPAAAGIIKTPPDPLTGCLVIASALAKTVRAITFCRLLYFSVATVSNQTNGVAMGSVKKKRLKKMSKHKRKKQLKALRHKNK